MALIWMAVMFFIQMCLLLPCSSVVAEPAPNGVDLWEVDGLHFPDYGACTNLILNPSFEAGFRYWDYLCFAQDVVPVAYSNFETIDSNEAHSGSHSLRLLAGSVRDPLGVGTFPIPVNPNTNYTLSFWAKNNSASAKLYVWGRGRTAQLFSPSNILVFDANSTWQRFTVSVTPQERFISIFFEGRGWGGTGYVWVDDIQFEEGSSATSFVQPPVAAKLVSSARGNFLEFGQSPNFSFAIHSSPNTSGTVTISVQDFFYNNVFTNTNGYQFTTNGSGDTTVSLSDLSSAIVNGNLRGVFIVTAVFNISGVSRAYTDYFRFSVMDFLDNTHKNKDLFNLTFVYQNQMGGPEIERFLERERAIGFGSFTYDFSSFADDLGYDLDEERMQLAEDYGLTCVGRPVLQLHGAERGIISEDGGTYVMTNVNNKTNPTSQELSDFADICHIKAENRPWNKIWWFTGESYVPNQPDSGCMPLADFETYPYSFAKFLIATCQGIKAGDPNAKVLIEGGPWKLDTQSIGWIEKYIQDTNYLNPNMQFDGAAVHHYRNFPENPDLDADVDEFLTMLNDNGRKDWQLYINEGGNYCPFNIPGDANITGDSDISPYVVQSGNSWYMGPLSYHSGWAERITAAFSARNWLVALKYQSRLACMEDFYTPSRFTDIDFTSRFYEKIPNTLGRILGNASFVRDIRFAPYCRGYLFKDDSTGSPIAVIWSYKESVDTWQESPPYYAFNFGSQTLTFIDLMENEVDYTADSGGRTIIPISPFPLFIKGVSGTENQLCDAITNAGKVIMDSTHHNGSFTNGPTGYGAGFWYNTANAIPTGWTETVQYMYTTGALWVQCGTYADAVNNTGELVEPGKAYTVSADLGGTDGTDATVRVYATQNSDGTGTKVLLASVHRIGHTSDGYSLFPTTGTPGSPASSSLAGYYIQVEIGGYIDHYIAGYYDNIVVTSRMPVIMDGTHHNGSFTNGPTGYGAGFWYNTATSIPTGWTETTQYMYTTGTRWVQCGSVAEAVNNTGELVQVGQAYTVSADLGGAGCYPTVRVYATQNSDGTGTKVLLASVQRYLPTGPTNYTLYSATGTPGTTVNSNLTGYYIQVKIGGPYADYGHYISGYYDNIVVTSDIGQ